MPKAENSSPPKKWKERESIIAPRSADDREEEKPFSTNRIVGSMAEKGRGKQSSLESVCRWEDRGEDTEKVAASQRRKGIYCI